MQIERFTGADVRPHLDAVAALRIEVFREYPYLYDGDRAYERRYLRTYSEAPDSLFVLALDGDDVVGAATGVPLIHEEATFQQPWIARGVDPATVFYFGESVLRRRYRGRGLGHRFFDEREAFARALDGMRCTAFCAVERPPDHPRRPADYRPLDAFWRRRGYEKQPQLRTAYTWQDLDEDAPSPKPMVFWCRQLPPDGP